MAGVSFDAASGTYSTYAAKTPSRTPLTQQTYIYREGPAKVTEHHYELPKGQHTNLVGSFSYRTPSAKTGQLKARLAQESRKMKAQEIKDKKAGKVNHQKRARIKCRMKYLQDQLNAEIAKSPITRVVVRERDDESGEDTSRSLEAQAYNLLLSSRNDTGTAAAADGESAEQI